MGHHNLPGRQGLVRCHSKWDMSDNRYRRRLDQCAVDIGRREIVDFDEVISGLFLLCHRLKARVDARALLEEALAA